MAIKSERRIELKNGLKFSQLAGLKSQDVSSHPKPNFIRENRKTSGGAKSPPGLNEKLMKKLGVGWGERVMGEKFIKNGMKTRLM